MKVGKDFPYMLVEWNDAYGTSEDDVFTLDDLTDHRPIRMRTRGMILLDNEHGITMTSEDYLDNNKQYFRGRQFIPRGMIVSVTPVKTVRSKKKAPAPSE
jgi:hypothetical protein